MGSAVKWVFNALFGTMSIVKLFLAFECRKIPRQYSLWRCHRCCRNFFKSWIQLLTRFFSSQTIPPSSSPSRFWEALTSWAMKSGRWAEASSIKEEKWAQACEMQKQQLVGALGLLWKTVEEITRHKNWWRSTRIDTRITSELHKYSVGWAEGTWHSHTHWLHYFMKAFFQTCPFG